MVKYKNKEVFESTSVDSLSTFYHKKLAFIYSAT